MGALHSYNVERATLKNGVCRIEREWDVASDDVFQCTLKTVESNKRDEVLSSILSIWASFLLEVDSSEMRNEEKEIAKLIPDTEEV